MTTAETDPQATPEFAAGLASAPASLTSPVIDYEPPARPLGAPAPATPCPAAPRLRGHPARRLRLVESPPQPPAPQPPGGAVRFAEVTLRRALEVVDRRRPSAQLRTLMSPLVIDVVTAMARSRPGATATLRQVRLRAATESAGAEVFATYTRAGRVRAIAARIEILSGRWQMTALQIG